MKKKCKIGFLTPPPPYLKIKIKNFTLHLGLEVGGRLNKVHVKGAVQVKVQRLRTLLRTGPERTAR